MLHDRSLGVAWVSCGIFLLALCTPFAFRNARWIRPLLYFLAIVTGVLNALGHMVATIAGRTVSTVHFQRPAPGFYSSPFLSAAAIYALVQLRRMAGGQDSAPTAWP
jgi:hypothetical protein